MSKLYNAGEYTLISFGLVKENDYIDLSSVMFDITLYESIFDQTMTGNASIIESDDLINTLPIVGGEEIVLQFNTDGSEEELTFRAKLVKVDKQERITEHSSGYIIHFVSRETDIAFKTYIVEGYEDTTSNICKKVFDKIKLDKELVAQDTNGIERIAFPRLKTLQAINYLCKKSVSSSDQHGFLFYENNREFRFTSIQELYKQDVVTEFYYKNAGVFQDVKQKSGESFQAIQDYSILETDTYFNRINDGLQGSTHDHYDMIKKSYTRKEYDKLSQYDSEQSLGDIASKSDYEVDNTFSYRFTLGYDSNIEPEEFKHSMRILESKTFVADIMVYGDSNIKVGDVVLATLPSFNSDQQKIRNTVNGRFLVTDIKHHLSKRIYMQQLTIAKDAYVKD